MPDLNLTLFYIVLSFVLVGLNGFFVAAEFAIVKVRRSRLEELAGKGVAAARISILCVDNLDESLSATQLGITLVSLGLGWVGEDSFYNLLFIYFGDLFPGQETAFHGVALALSFFIITLLHVVLGELVPKSMAIQRAERITLWVSRPLGWFFSFAKPLIFIFTVMANFVLRRLGYDGSEEDALSEEELRIVMRESHEDGVISDSEAQIITRAFSFSDKRASDIMVPADRVQFLSLAKTIDENLETTKRRFYTRFPLVSEGLDSVIGVVHMKDAWRELADDRSNKSFARTARPAVSVDSKMRQDKILKVFKDAQSHMALVRDGATQKIVGLVTMEDILEELVGDIRDEHGN